MVLRTGSAAEAGMIPERVAGLKELARGWVDEGHTPALVVLVARRGVIALHEAYGRLRPEEGSPPLAGDTIFPVASISKPISATAVMALVEDGRLGLNRPIADYLPELSGDGKNQVLVRHLLTHTSGFDQEELDALTFNRAVEAFGGETVDRLQALSGDEQFEALKQAIEKTWGASPDTQHPVLHMIHAVLKDAPLAKAPRAEMMYADYNYALLGEILRRISGQSLDDFARERIFGPLGMSDTSFTVPDSVRHRIVKRPADAVGAPAQGVLQGMDSRMWQELPHPGGGLFSTARDLAVFGQTFLDGGSYGDARILSRASVEEMTRNHNAGLTAKIGSTEIEAGYGFGWFVPTSERWRYMGGSVASLGSFEHAGHGGSAFWVDPGRELVGVYLSVLLEETADEEPLWNYDLFQNAVTAAVDD